MGIYRLLSGRHRRFEDGTLCEYVAGDLIDLDVKESARLRHRIRPVGRAAAKRAPKQREQPTVFTPGDTHAMTVSQLKTVIANAKKPAQLDDIEEQEGKNNKPRVTVFRAIERRRKQMIDDE